MSKNAAEIIRSIEVVKNELGKYIADAVILPRARELFGECLENFPKMDFEDADEKIVKASGILIAEYNDDCGSMASCYGDAAYRVVDFSKEAVADSLVFCQRGLFLHEKKSRFSENSLIDSLMEAPIDYYIDFGAAIILAMEEEYRKQNS